jgi:hypothetical protein
LLAPEPIEETGSKEMKYNKENQIVDDGDFEGGDKSDTNSITNSNSNDSKAMFLEDYASQGMKVKYIDLL